MIWLPLAVLLGALVGAWFGARSAVVLRRRFLASLTELDRNVDELSRMMHDGRVAPAAVHGFIAAVRTEFTLRWEQPH